MAGSSVLGKKSPHPSVGGCHPEAAAQQCVPAVLACARRSCLRGLLTLMAAAMAWALSEDFFIPLKVVHAASFAALFALKLIFFFFFQRAEIAGGSQLDASFLTS